MASWSINKKGKERANIEHSYTVTKARAIVVSNFIKVELLNFMQSEESSTDIS